MPKLEVCFTPKTYEEYRNNDAIVVVTDILRATSSICTAFINGAEKLIPVRTVEEAKDYKRKGFTVAAERDGFVLDFADLGNSPENFTPELVQNHTLVYSTTNGTNSIMMAKEAREVLIGSYLNLKATADYLIEKGHDVLILCAAWKNKFNLEDSVYAGALAELLLEAEFETICDSTKAAIDLWGTAKEDLMGYINKTAQKGRLAKNGLDGCIEYCHTFNISTIIPKLENNYLVAAN
ncbi:2-phosphosulfolactate phosphatase [Bacteroidales bacterium]|nr:2-phosphosulfolactate phosphatase [Bacteroidales bacterium]